MSEELTKEEKCVGWAAATEVFGKEIKKIASRIVLSEEDKKELEELLKHLKVSVKATDKQCRILLSK